MLFRWKLYTLVALLLYSFSALGDENIERYEKIINSSHEEAKSRFEQSCVGNQVDLASIRSMDDSKCYEALLYYQVEIEKFASIKSSLDILLGFEDALSERLLNRIIKLYAIAGETPPTTVKMGKYNNSLLDWAKLRHSLGAKGYEGNLMLAENTQLNSSKHEVTLLKSLLSQNTEEYTNNLSWWLKVSSVDLQRLINNVPFDGNNEIVQRWLHSKEHADILLHWHLFSSLFLSGLNQEASQLVESDWAKIADITKSYWKFHSFIISNENAKNYYSSNFIKVGGLASEYPEMGFYKMVFIPGTPDESLSLYEKMDNIAQSIDYASYLSQWRTFVQENGNDQNKIDNLLLLASLMTEKVLPNQTWSKSDIELFLIPNLEDISKLLSKNSHKLFGCSKYSNGNAEIFEFMSDFNKEYSGSENRDIYRQFVTCKPLVSIYKGMLSPIVKTFTSISKNSIDACVDGWKHSGRSCRFHSFMGLIQDKSMMSLFLEERGLLNNLIYGISGIDASDPEAFALFAEHEAFYYNKKSAADGYYCAQGDNGMIAGVSDSDNLYQFRTKYSLKLYYLMRLMHYIQYGNNKAQWQDIALKIAEDTGCADPKDFCDPYELAKDHGLLSGLYILNDIQTR